MQSVVLAAGTDKDTSIGNGGTALYIASQHGHLAVAGSTTGSTGWPNGPAGRTDFSGDGQKSKRQRREDKREGHSSNALNNPLARDEAALAIERQGVIDRHNRGFSGNLDCMDWHLENEMLGNGSAASSRAFWSDTRAVDSMLGAPVLPDQAGTRPRLALALAPGGKPKPKPKQVRKQGGKHGAVAKNPTKKGGRRGNY